MRRRESDVSSRDRPSPRRAAIRAKGLPLPYRVAEVDSPLFASASVVGTCKGPSAISSGGFPRQTGSPSARQSSLRGRFNSSRFPVSNPGGTALFNTAARCESRGEMVHLTKAMHFPLHTSVSATRIYGSAERLAGMILPYLLALGLSSVMPRSNAVVFLHARCRRLSGPSRSSPRYLLRICGTPDTV
jgi:hypothetical protein